MELSIRQTIAWVLIIAGLSMVFWDVCSSYFFFSGKHDFPQVFVASQEEAVDSSSSSGTLQDQIGSIVKDQLKQLLPENTVTQLLNMTSWIIFATFFLWAGIKIAGLGNNLLKKE